MIKNATLAILGIALASTGCGDDDDPAIQNDSDTEVETGPIGGNVLILFLDDVGVDKVGAYGVHPDAPPTPNIDGLADGGVLFRAGYANPSCSPSRASLLTGRYGRRTGLGGVTELYSSSYSLPHDEVVLPEVVKASATLDYDTSMVGKWHLTNGDVPDYENEPLTHGFDWYAGSLGNLTSSTDRTRPLTYYNWQKCSNGTLAMTQEYATTDTVDDALDRVTQMPEPWLLYVAFNAPHTPLGQPPPELHTQTDLTPQSDRLERYDATMEALDTEIGRLLGGLDVDVRDRTTILLIGDNGTPEHAVAPPFSQDQSKLAQFEGGILVPFIVTGPAVGQPGTESHAMVHVVDVLPTVAELAGVDVSELLRNGAPVVLDGQSLVPHLADPETVGRETLYAERFFDSGAPPYGFDARSVRDDRYKLIYKDGLVGFFELGVDPPHEGPDLMEVGLSAVQQAAFDALEQDMARRVADMVYEGP